MILCRFNMEKMLDRLLMVREVQEHMLADQASWLPRTLT